MDASPDFTSSFEHTRDLNFTEALNDFYLKFMILHFRHNEDIASFRLNYVAVVREYYQSLIELFATDIDVVNRESELFNRVYNQAIVELGGENECLVDVQSQFKRSLRLINSLIRVCSNYASYTMSGLMKDTFYPLIGGIQNLVSMLPITMMDGLARSNPLQNPTQVIKFLQSSYDLSDLSWSKSVMLQITWETRRFLTRVDFLLDQSILCVEEDLVDFIFETVNFLMGLRQCVDLGKKN